MTAALCLSVPEMPWLCAMFSISASQIFSVSAFQRFSFYVEVPSSEFDLPHDDQHPEVESEIQESLSQAHEVGLPYPNEQARHDPEQHHPLRPRPVFAIRSASLPQKHGSYHGE